VELEVALANGTLASFNEDSYPHLFKALQVPLPFSSTAGAEAVIAATCSLNAAVIMLLCRSPLIY
jgi:hypothetical protein